MVDPIPLLVGVGLVLLLVIWYGDASEAGSGKAAGRSFPNPNPTFNLPLGDGC